MHIFGRVQTLLDLLSTASHLPNALRVRQWGRYMCPDVEHDTSRAVSLPRGGNNGECDVKCIETSAPGVEDPSVNEKPKWVRMCMDEGRRSICANCGQNCWWPVAELREMVSGIAFAANIEEMKEAVSRIRQWWELNK